MNVEQIEVFVQYACGDTVKVTVPAMVVGIPLVPSFSMPIIGECPEGTMAIPKTYVSEPYPVLSSDMVKASNDVLGFFMKYINAVTTISPDEVTSGSNLIDIYFKNINVSSLVSEGVATATDLTNIYFKSINVYCEVSESVGANSDISEVTLIDLNRYYTVEEKVTSSCNVSSIVMEASPRTTVEGNEPDGIEAVVPEFVSSEYTIFASLDNLSGDTDGIESLVPSFIAGIYTTYMTYEVSVAGDGVQTLSPEFIDATYTTYTVVDATVVGDGVFALVPEFISGVIT